MKRPRPRKVIVTALVFLLLGAIVNIAVAWGLVLLSGIKYSEAVELADDSAREWWRANAPPGFADAPKHVTTTFGFGVRSLRLSEVGTVETRYMQLALRHAWGWPCLSMEWTTWASGRPLTSERRSAFLYAGWPLAPGRQAYFPCSPLWPGFAINTLFYAAILWLLFAAPFVLRRWRRIKRGLCPACAYPVGTSDLCTECGKPIPSPLRG